MSPPSSCHAVVPRPSTTMGFLPILQLITFGPVIHLLKVSTELTTYIAYNLFCYAFMNSNETCLKCFVAVQHL